MIPYPKSERMKSKVSIIVPCYNQGIYLGEALDSVLAQTYQNWECIIINDGSTDDTETIANKYCQIDTRFYYIHQENQRLCATRNNAIRHSSGEYILPLDADDKIAPSLLEKSVAILESNSRVSIVLSETELFGDQHGLYDIPAYSIDRMLLDNCIHNTSMFRRSDYDKTKGYRQCMNEGIEDWDFWLSIIELGGAVYKIDEVLNYYRIKKVSLRTSIGSKADYLKLRIIRNHSLLYLKRSPFICVEYFRIRKKPFRTLYSFTKRNLKKKFSHK